VVEGEKIAQPQSSTKKTNKKEKAAKGTKGIEEFREILL